MLDTGKSSLDYNGYAKLCTISKKMKLHLIFICAISLNGVYAQEIENFSADNPKHFNRIIEFEKNLGSRNNGFHSFQPYFDERFEDMIPNVKPKALIFERNSDSFSPNLHTWYFFDSDSLVRGWYYNWGFYNPSFNPSENRELLEKQKPRKDDYEAHYELIMHNLKSIIGEPTEKKTLINRRKFLAKYATWDKENFRTILEVRFDPSIKDVPGTSFIAGGESHILIKTFYK